MPSNLSSLLQRKTIGFIGAGTMGQALMRGLIAQGLNPGQLLAADANPSTRRSVEKSLRVPTVAENAEVIQAADIILLAVKPQQLADVLREIKSLVTPRQLVISIAAGISLHWLQKYLGRVPLVRVMPNLPATVGCGFSAIALGRTATSRHGAMARALFGAVGDVVELPERLFDAITAVSGSGPAYLFFFVDAWERAARALGLPSSIATAAVRATLAGSLRLLQMSGEQPATLIRRVASKKGTTEAALRVLTERHVAQHVTEALRAAARRSKELTRQRS